MYTLRPEEVARRVETELEHGLSRAEAARRLERHGANALVESPGPSPLTIFLAQFKSLIVALLLVAAAVALALGDTIESGAIFVVIILNALIGFFTEWKAQQTLAALRRQTSPTAQVIRDDQEHEISAAELVPGDVEIGRAHV